MYIQPENDGTVQTTQNEAPSPTESEGGDETDMILEISIMVSAIVMCLCCVLIGLLLMRLSKKKPKTDRKITPSAPIRQMTYSNKEAIKKIPLEPVASETNAGDSDDEAETDFDFVETAMGITKAYSTNSFVGRSFSSEGKMSSIESLYSNHFNEVEVKTPTTTAGAKNETKTNDNKHIGDV